MELTKLLKENREKILKTWFEMIVAFYPEEMVYFISNEKDRFLNPVGSIISEGIGVIYDVIAEGKDKGDTASAIDNIMKIMAIEDIKPSIATSFGYFLKRILMEWCAPYLKESKLLEELHALNDRIDEITLMAFDFYMGCREQINRIRIKELMSERARGIDNFLNFKVNS